jgi:hypothetical protein
LAPFLKREGLIKPLVKNLALIGAQGGLGKNIDRSQSFTTIALPLGTTQPAGQNSKKKKH